MNNIHFPTDGTYSEDQNLVFLAGPCRGAPQWQIELARMCEDLPIKFANPRREVAFAGDDYDSYLEQVGWEYDHLRAAKTIVFWLACSAEDIPGRSYAQTTRYELAEWLTRAEYEDVDIVLGIEEGFHGRKYIEERVKDQNIKVVRSLTEVAEQLAQRYK